DLSPDDHRALHDLTSRLVAALVRTKDGGAWTCRLCDLDACGRPAGRCPAANAAAERFGVRPPGTSPALSRGRAYSGARLALGGARVHTELVALSSRRRCALPSRPG